MLKNCENKLRNQIETMTNNIRDYIYLDTGRAGSLYAQASGGLVESFINSQNEEETMHHRERGAPLSGSELTKELLIGSKKIETRILHDYLFTELEKLLDDNIVGINSENISTVLPGQLIKVTGIAEIDDTQRLQALMENFNDFQRSIYFAGVADAVQKKIRELETKLETASGQNKKKLEQELEKLSLNALGRQYKIGIPDITVKALSLFFKLLYTDIFEIKVITPFNKDYIFRAILNREYLREDSAVIYAKYGSRTQVPWTMVGQVTTIDLPGKVGETGDRIPEIAEDLAKQGLDVNPDSFVKKEKVKKEDETASQETASPDGNIRDSIETLYDSISEIEQIFTKSLTRTSWVITPLAIYYNIT